jgi:iron complex transport system substrate-binding protein
MRVISLLASGTEIVCALGAGDTLVGRSHECDHPGWVRTLPACTRPAFDVTVSSRAIDAEVRRRLHAGEPLYLVDADLLQALQPDLLITQVHCDVCAVTPDDVSRAGCAGHAAPIVSLSAGSVAGIYDGIRTIAHALHRDEAGVQLIADMQDRIDRVRARVSSRSVPTVILLEWTDPIFAAGNWAPELVEAAGGRLLLAEKGRHSTAIPWEQIVQADPEYLIVAPCGFDLERTWREVPTLEALPGWATLTAVRTGHAAFADGNQYFNRSGTTIVETVEVIAEILHGDHVGARWCDHTWRPYHPVARSLERSGAHMR